MGLNSSCPSALAFEAEDERVTNHSVRSNARFLRSMRRLAFHYPPGAAIVLCRRHHHRRCDSHNHHHHSNNPPSTPSPLRRPLRHDPHAPPLTTRTLHPFENAFFFYQKRLEERLNTPFITSIYYKPDTARRLDWDLKVQSRGGTVAKELGVYNGKASRAWDDELRVGDKLSDQESVLGALLKDAEARVSDDAEMIAPEDVVKVEAPPERVTEADRKGDVKRLDRKLDRTLYLVVKSEGRWVFPSDVIAEGENLHEVRISTTPSQVFPMLT